MFFKYIELLFYIILSNTHTIIYLCMMLSMYQNAGLMSIVYPISIFGYALIEETRPRRGYWDFLRIYTIVILVIKFIWNLSIFDDFAKSSSFKFFHGQFRLGLYNYDSYLAVINYMLPEMLIIVFLLLNEIMLRLNGVFFAIEEDHETIYDGIERWKAKGDERTIKEA